MMFDSMLDRVVDVWARVMCVFGMVAFVVCVVAIVVVVVKGL